jgi:[ribosomal protein S5]-alanine N-acetyltransferase
MLRSENMVLRMIREADLDHLYLLETDIDSREQYSSPSLQSEVMLRKQFFENGLWGDDAGHLLICSPDNRILGKLSFYKERAYYNAVEVGYILYDRAGRGKGVMTEALTLFVEYLFFSKSINRIELVAAVENTASRRVAEKCGFTLARLYPCQVAKANVSVRCSKTTRGVFTMSVVGRDIAERATGHRWWRTYANVSANVGVVFRYHAACRNGSGAPWSSSCAHSVTKEKSPSNAGVVRMIAASDHWRCVSIPRWVRVS